MPVTRKLTQIHAIHFIQGTNSYRYPEVSPNSGVSHQKYALEGSRPIFIIGFQWCGCMGVGVVGYNDTLLAWFAWFVLIHVLLCICFINSIHWFCINHYTINKLTIYYKLSLCIFQSFLFCLQTLRNFLGLWDRSHSYITPDLLDVFNQNITQ